MRIYLAQINSRVGDIKYNQSLILSEFEKAENGGFDLAIFPEMALCGYDAKDLWQKEVFLSELEKSLKEILAASKSKKCALLFGSVFKDKKGIFNAAYLIENGEIKNVIQKKNLPNEGVFDEKRYFQESKFLHYVEFKGVTLAILICEDLWNVKNKFLLQEQVFDLLISINSSPYEHEKHFMREKIVNDLSKEIKKPIIYLNQVGGQDHLVFDGSSFIFDYQNDKNILMKSFVEDQLGINFEKNGEIDVVLGQNQESYDEIVKRDYLAAVLGLHDYVVKSGFKKVMLGMSGGIDSALVAAIAVDALGSENVALYALPSRFNSEESMNDAVLAAKNLGVELQVISIEEGFNVMLQSLNGHEISSLAQENMQSRIRGNILMSLSNSSGALLLSTGNKSELAVGYATIYGDMCGAYNPIKDLYKSEVYKVANWRNENLIESGLQKRMVIPKNIIKKEPSAELREDQKDSDSLPDYEILDKILYQLIEEEKSVENIIKMGYDDDLVIKIAKLLKNSEYKRRQSVIGAKLSKKSFDFDRRYPIANGFFG